MEPYRGVVEVPALEKKTEADRLRLLTKTEGEAALFKEAAIIWDNLMIEATNRAKAGFEVAWVYCGEITGLQLTWITSKAREEAFKVEYGYKYPASKQEFFIKIKW